MLRDDSCPFEIFMVPKYTGHVILRAAQAEDETFLFELYSSTRAEEMASWGWNEAQRQAFLSMQFRGQRAHYAEYPNVDHRIILLNGEPVGRIFISRMEAEIRLVDISLLPAYRERGLGAALIRELFEEAARTRKVIQLHVEKNNRALQLYQRLGFEIVGDAASHWFMIWRPIDQNDKTTGE